MLQQDKLDFFTRRSHLSTSKRMLLEKRLRGDSAGVSGAPSIPRLSQQGPVPLSLTQQGLWILDQLMSDIPLYNVPIALRFMGSLNISVLQQSLDTIVQRHETLRTTFRMIEGQPMQVIARSLSIPLSIVDLRGCSQVIQEVKVQQLASEEVRQPFTLSQGPLLRANVIYMDADTSLLLLTMHHIISDGWSLGILVQELTALYKAFSKNFTSPLLALPIQYTDFAIWQHKTLQGELLTEHLIYWKQQLAGSPEQLSLPTDRPHTQTLTAQGASYQMVLPEGLTSALNVLSQQEGVTLYMTLVAAFQSLLCRYSGQEDIIIGTASAGRTQEDIESLIGFFVNTLVLRTNLAGNPTFKELLQRVRVVILEAHQHQMVPFEVLVKEIQPERHLGQNPVFRVMLTMEPSLPNLPDGWMVAPMKAESETAKFDLSLALKELPRGLLATFEYRADLFDKATIVRMMGHLQMLLEEIVAEPNQRIATLPLLTKRECHQFLVEWNTTSVAHTKDKCIHQLFEEQADRTPEAVAVVFEDKQLTYKELNRRANQLAHYLQKLGVGPEVLVGLCVERSQEMVISILGVLKAGGAYVPLDPAYPKERLAFTIEDAQLLVLLTQQELLTQLPDHKALTVCLDTDWEAANYEGKENAISEVIADNPAYVIYTSGSAGKPKGVVVSHHNIVRLFGASYTYFNFDERDVWTLFHSYSFDFSVWELWGALIHGGRLVLVSYLVSRSPEAFYDVLRSERVTVLNQTPSAFLQLIKVEDSTAGPLELPALRLIIFGGEALDFQSLKPWFEHHGDLSPRLVNMYGITETTVHVTYRLLTMADVDRSSRSVIGRPIPDLQVYVLDQQMQLLPAGVPGEIYVGGAGLARSYLNHQELTAERFIPDPFRSESGARLYKTGDLGCYLPNGDLEYQGRLDQQVKLRGFRIELGEIEALLSGYPALRQSVVVMREDNSGDKHLVAYLVFRAEESVKLDDLKSYMAKLVPAYMVPSAFLILEKLPLTTNGKVDRRALPVPDFIRRPVEESFVSPTHMLHFQLVAIWEDLLNVHPISIADNFFYQGGHSLLAVRLLERIEQVFHQKIQLNILFANPTIEGLTEVLRAKIGYDFQLPIIAIQTGEAKRPFFFLHGEWRGDAFYCYPLAKALGKEQPFYAIPPYQLSGASVAPSMEEIAAYHIEMLQSVQPNGPYMLGGWCNGALVAYEMARQLHVMGQMVDLLILINPADLTSSWRLRTACKVIDHIGRLFHLSSEKKLNCFLRLNHLSCYLFYPDYKESVDFEHLKSAIQTKWAKWGKRSAASLSYLELLFPPIESLRTYPLIFARIAANYIPLSQYPGKMTFFWHRDELSDRAAWQQVVKAVAAKEYFLPGTHETLLTNHLSSVAEQMELCLEEANGLKREKLVSDIGKCI